jgi:hypothetical protein
VHGEGDLVRKEVRHEVHHAREHQGHHHALLPAEHLADPQQQPGEDRKK